MVEELLANADEIISSQLTYIEMRAALSAARRAGRISGSRVNAMRENFEGRWRGVLKLEVSQPLVLAAAEVAEVYGLRANDAVHLASALVLEDSDLWLSTWDGELRAAALAAGLPVVP